MIVITVVIMIIITMVIVIVVAVVIMVAVIVVLVCSCHLKGNHVEGGQVVICGLEFKNIFSFFEFVDADNSV